MTQRQKFGWWIAALLVVGAISFSVAGPRIDKDLEGARPTRKPLMVRGFTDATMAEVVLDGVGSDTVLELRVVEGQQVKRGDVVAVLANYPLADIAVRSAEAELEKAQARRKSLMGGIPVAEVANDTSEDAPKSKTKSAGPPKRGVAEQEVMVKLSAEEAKLKTLNMQRSGLPPDQRELEITVSNQNVEHEQARLRVLKETLADDLAKSDAEIALKKAKLEDAQLIREQALVRSPLDGVVLQIWTHPGERIRRGIAQIVDMQRLRIVADVDEVLLDRMKVGAKVNVTFRGEKTSHEGRIVLVGSEIRRTPNQGSFGSSTTKVRSIPVKIELNDPSQMPQMVGREAIVTFEGGA
ncbi:Multidrug resistance efflux pump [Enhydrobacter aerosaccus]|uniref:Multidrug resistance efflux pump n=1 Tax=Enhydrobacter aerosaccus TaxID=225324 RepID=A0A1T4JK28_9HYPH|nr:HlyD family efflux transporter periplasmic adaptor subunit [Enhydrobacter aerosaccus]SJZ30509.1 Multidrug resistance efflux pump [Enhydrobacter aerosaccus]